MRTWRKRYGKKGTMYEMISRDQAAQFIRQLRRSIREEQRKYLADESYFFTDQWHRIGMINGLLICMGGSCAHPKWMMRGEYDLKKMKEAAHEKAVADSLV